ncbi:putative thiazole-containing bacteriocin maturation protein [Bacillus sp. N1-1]|jgi:putative thiazole-containing bacteriocin maturation protein|uniref:putative thiazole-containing bacteriocin maturation protein n=1 Tax=Bacillus sp. N1-1 TaxID=2682541 RepID=UPI00131940E3|nr:putative thiazole-containing bacteriocin maturation protein [Bacillus sp. N1-1]QHA91207.1 putative thiazole-containing bacteriocin maturation protein [Bacillus sp. N1-1]
MTNVHPSMRLKLKKGTFFMPEPSGSVYFRNNSGSFRMEGNTIYQWIEKLIPMYNGEYPLATLTDGLSKPYRDRVYEITDTLFTNGFLRDISRDRPHQLEPNVVQKYASQIEYIESFTDSGAYRFQQYRQKNVLVVGEGSMLIGLVSSLLTSGLPRFQTLLTDAKTSQQRIKQLETAARKSDPEVSIEVLLKRGPIAWERQIEPFDAILYVSSEENVQELRSLLHACKERKKTFLPAICTKGVGMAGPLVTPDGGCWESAWRSLHLESLNNRSFSPTAGAMLANVIVFEWFKKSTGLPALSNNQVFLLNFETLEGKWHPYRPHPLVSGKIEVENVSKEFSEEKKKDPNKLLYYFSQLTSQLGIFHKWEEGELSQLPLAQCEIQTVNVKPSGSSMLHPSQISTALTHEEARRDAGLTGIEEYVIPLKEEITSSLSSPFEKATYLPTDLHIGAGESFVEAVSRALQTMIEEEWNQKADQCMENLSRFAVQHVEDNLCRYYLKVLSTMKKAPDLALGKETNGLPVVWRKAEDNRWYGSVGFTLVLALRSALLQAVKEAQNDSISAALSFSAIPVKDKPIQSIDIPAYDANDQADVLRSVINRFGQQNKELSIVKINLETFEKDGPIDIYGVLLREGETR